MESQFSFAASTKANCAGFYQIKRYGHMPYLREYYIEDNCRKILCITNLI